MASPGATSRTVSKPTASRATLSEATERLAGSLSAALLSIQQGAHIIRVHDVKPTMDMIKVMQACANYQAL